MADDVSKQELEAQPTPRESKLQATLAPAGRLLFALMLSLLPEGWRRRLESPVLPMVAATVLSGVAEALLALLLWLGTYLAYFTDVGSPFIARAGEMAAQSEWMPGRGVLMGFGGALFFRFLVTPMGIVLAYLWVEGILRAALTAPANRPIGSLSLWILERGTNAIGRWRAENRLGPLVVDEIVERLDEEEILVETCRCRDWDHLTALKYKDEVYRLVEHAQRPHGPRRHLYRLQVAPEWFVIRKLRPYFAKQILEERKPAWKQLLKKIGQ